MYISAFVHLFCKFRKFVVGPYYGVYGISEGRRARKRPLGLNQREVRGMNKRRGPGQPGESSGLTERAPTPGPKIGAESEFG